MELKRVRKDGRVRVVARIDELFDKLDRHEVVAAIEELVEEARAMVPSLESEGTITTGKVEMYFKPGGGNAEDA